MTLTPEQKKRIMQSQNFQKLVSGSGSSTASSSLSLRERANQLRAIQPTAQPEKKPGFFGRLKETGGDIFDTITGAGEAVGKRAGQIGQAIKKTVSGEINPISGIAQSAGSVAGLFNDISGELYTGVGKALLPQEAEDKVKEKIANIAKEVASLNAIKQGTQAWTAMEQKHPELAGNLKALTNMGLAYADIFGVGKAGTAAQKGANKIDDLAKAGRSAVSGMADNVTTVASNAAKKIGGAIDSQKGRQVGDYFLGQATGLNPQTVRKLIDEPQKYTDEILSSVDKESVALNVKDKIEARIKALQETGKGYDAIRNSPSTVKLSDAGITPILDKYKIFRSPDGKIVTTPESLPLTSADKNALQGFLDTFGDVKELSPNAFLNARKSLSDLSAFESGKSSASTTMAKELRKYYDEIGKTQIPGLKKLDDTYSKEIKILNKVKKDYFTKTGDFKDNAVFKISNLKNKEALVKRLEKIVPEIREQLNVLEVIKDIEYANGQKVGTYTRSIIGGVGLSTGNIPAMVAAIISSPKIAVPLLRKYGQIRKINGPLLNSTIKALQSGTTLVGRQLQLIKEFFRVKAEVVKKWIAELKNNQGGYISLPVGSGSIKNKADDLIQEAKKYKSAEEFVKANKVQSFLEKKHKDLDFFVSDRGGEINLSKIIVPKTERGKGAGTKFMNDLIEYADETGQRIVLTPSNSFGGSTSRLKGFYKRFGFFENKGRNKDFSTRESFIRPAKTKSQLEDIWKKANKKK